ncbi:cell envelope biogenesis protein TolA, partial [Candidatus Entotheonella serta]
MRAGYIISGIGHALFILWLLIGDFFSSAPPPSPAVAEVSIMSEAEFSELVSQSEATSKAEPDAAPASSIVPPSRPAPAPT